MPQQPPPDTLLANDPRQTLHSFIRPLPIDTILSRPTAQTSGMASLSNLDKKACRLHRQDDEGLVRQRRSAVLPVPLWTCPVCDPYRVATTVAQV